MSQPSPNFIFSQEQKFEALPALFFPEFAYSTGVINIFAAPYTQLSLEGYTPAHFGFYAITPKDFDGPIINSYQHDFGLMYIVHASANEFKELLTQSYKIIKSQSLKAQNGLQHLDVDDTILIWSLEHALPEHYLVFLASAKLEFSWPIYENMQDNSKIKIVARADCSRPLWPEEDSDFEDFSYKWEGKKADLKLLYSMTQTLSNENYARVIERASLEKNVAPALGETSVAKI